MGGLHRGREGKVPVEKNDWKKVSGQWIWKKKTKMKGKKYDMEKDSSYGISKDISVRLKKKRKKRENGTKTSLSPLPAGDVTKKILNRDK